MRLSSKPVVTLVAKRRLSHHSDQKSQTINSVHVTRIKSCTSNTIKDTNNATSTSQHVDMSSGNSDIVPKNSMNINVERSLSSVITIPFLPLHCSSPIIETPIQDISQVQSSTSFTSAAKVTFLNDNISMDTVIYPIQSPKKSNISSFTAVWHTRAPRFILKPMENPEQFSRRPSE